MSGKSPEGAPVAQSPEQRLALMRKGYVADLKLKLGGLEVPTRILPAQEQAEIMAQARMDAKIPESVKSPKDISALQGINVKIRVLDAATTIGACRYLGEKFLKQLTDEELDHAWDQWLYTQKFVNPDFDALSHDEVLDLIDAIKKKEQSARDCYSWQLAGIGLYFLEQILPKAKEPGSS